ncbi:MAG: ESPR-type extended signal peptide-containing protein [Phascolarctobacterium sp.]|uniref:ESPR-type extended signal peptide-containing protein n=1 Tax=Phascolarctobacterium sp. TaxID=2049039 RepID=UPI0026DCCEE4|nr:ESPR-type extended signal peptide-containing protein [Phascolarctobacterium sp.]MDO4921221.1 ESPR-type extended signal peptide-containing protein [Phascolarctobacterium sp.]
MNKIFKVIWSKARGCYVVASEFAKSHTKSGRAVKAVAVAAAALTLGMNGLALAAGTIGDLPKGDGQGIAIGEGSHAEHDSGEKEDNVAGHGKDIAIGSNAQALGEAWTDDGITYEGNSIAIGSEALAQKYSSVAIGSGTKSMGVYSTALGFDSQALGNRSVAMGVASFAIGDHSIAFGENAATADVQYNADGSIKVDENGNPEYNTAGFKAVAIGENSAAYGDSSIAIGDGTKSTNERGTALGSNSRALGSRSVVMGVSSYAIGDRSIAIGENAATAEVSYNPDGSIEVDENGNPKYNTDKKGFKAVAIGEAAVAYGTSSIAMGDGAKAYAQYSTASGIQARASGNNSTAIGHYSIANSTNDTAVGSNAEALGSYGTAVGKSAHAVCNNSTAVGVSARAASGYSVAIGDTSVAAGDNSLALGSNASTGTVVRGDDDKIIIDQHNGKVTVNTYAKNAVTIGAYSSAEKDNSTAIGYKAMAKGLYSTVAGDNATAEGDYSSAFGNEAHSIGAYSIAVGSKSTANDKSSVALGYQADAIGEDNVALGSYSDNAYFDTEGYRGYSNTTVYKDGNVAVFGTSDGSLTKLSLKVGDFAGWGSQVYGTVSVGYTDDKGGIHTRTITNVAAGMIAEGSTDAINGSQLYAVAKGLQDQIDKANNDDHYHTVNGEKPKTDASDSTTGDASGNASSGNNSNNNNAGSTVTAGGATNTGVADAGSDESTDTSKGHEPTGDVPELNEGYIGNKGNLSIEYATDKDGKKYYDISMKDNLDLSNTGSIKFGDTNNTYIDGDEIKIGDTHITDKSVKVGDTFNIDNSKKEVTVGKNVNIDMGDNIIHNVAPGVADTDAVNVSQLKELNQNIENNSVQINKLKGRIDKVGAGAAALAALHPLDFDPDDKFYLSAGYGHYRGENAVAVGAFYQPNDDTLFSVSSTVGNDDDMINAGITWRFGQQSHQSRSKKAMAKEIIELRTEVAELKAMVYSLTGYGLDLEKSKLFPDTPENHWAYDYVAVVAGNGILEGYPNGQFDGSRPMTRYEMAAVVYRLLQKGVQVDNRMIQEFAPELARVRVDTLTHYNDGTPHIQRVRVIKGRG